MADITLSVNQGFTSDFSLLSAATAVMTSGNHYTILCNKFICEDSVVMPTDLEDFSCVIKADPSAEHGGVSEAGFVLVSKAHATLLLTNSDRVTVEGIEVVNYASEAVHYALRNSGINSPNNRLRDLILRYENASHKTQKCAHITTKVKEINGLLCIGGEQGIFVRDGNILQNVTCRDQVRCFNTDHSDCVAIKCTARPKANPAYDGPLSVAGFGADNGGSWLTESCLDNASTDATAPGANAQHNIAEDNPDSKVCWTLDGFKPTTLTRKGRAVTKLVATKANATAIGHANTLASGVHASKWEIERKTGSGAISLSLDGGATYTDVTSSVGADGSGPGECIIDQELANPRTAMMAENEGDAVFVYNASVVPNRTAADLVGVTVPVTGDTEASIDVAVGEV